ncbi:MAG: hemolysin III family protein [Coriobacteriia bacterium]|nr:hemolysin III family protein [Coriobacteriia bacterium]
MNTESANVSGPSRRDYTLGEEIANSVIHGLGIGLSVAALVLLVAFAVLSGDPYRLASAIVYGISLVLAYTASTLYHSFPQPKVKHVFKILDHCAIYVLIAGTYTPYCLVTVREDGGWRLFWIIWSLALIGIALEAFWAYRPRWLSAVVYLGMGWMVIGSIEALTANLAPAGVWLLVAGGLCYTVGTIFYVLKQVKYMHAVWHLWVVAGSVCHFLSVLLFVMR